MRMVKTRATCLLVAVCGLMAVTLLAACGGEAAQTTHKGKPPRASIDKQVFRYPVIGDISATDPAFTLDQGSTTVITAVYTGLVTLDDHLKVVDQMATSHQVSADGLTYTFTLHAGMRFSDGTPLTSQDVIYSINRAIDPATKSDVSYYLHLIKDFYPFQSGQRATLIGDSLFAPDPTTVKIVISSRAPYFLQALSYPSSYVVEQRLIERYGASYFTDHMDAGGSSGPFKVAHYSHTTDLDLVPNPLYYGAKPVLQHYDISFYQDEESIFKAYQAGQVDYTSVPPAERATARTEPGFGEVPQLTILFLTMNYLSRPFDNIKIRQAFALAINKDLLVKTVLRGVFFPTNHLVPQGMPGYNQALTGPDGRTSTGGNASLAVHLLHEGMVEEGVTTLPPVTLTFTAAFQDVVTAMKEMWQRVLGVTVQLQEQGHVAMLDQEQATQHHAGPLQMWTGGWQADYPDPQDWLSIFFAKGADNNQCNYGQNSTTAALAQQQVQNDLLRADGEQNATKRLQMYAVAEQQIVNDVGWVPLWQETLQELLRPKVQQLIINAENVIPPEDWGSIYIA